MKKVLLIALVALFGLLVLVGCNKAEEPAATTEVTAPATPEPAPAPAPAPEMTAPATPEATPAAAPVEEPKPAEKAPAKKAK